MKNTIFHKWLVARLEGLGPLLSTNHYPLITAFAVGQKSC